MTVFGVVLMLINTFLGGWYAAFLGMLHGFFIGMVLVVFMFVLGQILFPPPGADRIHE